MYVMSIIWSALQDNKMTQKKKKKKKNARASLCHAMVPPAPCLVLALVHASSHFVVLDVDMDVEAWLSVVKLLWGIEKGGRWNWNRVWDVLRVGSRIEWERCVPSQGCVTGGWWGAASVTMAHRGWSVMTMSWL